MIVWFMHDDHNAEIGHVVNLKVSRLLLPLKLHRKTGKTIMQKNVLNSFTSE